MEPAGVCPCDKVSSTWKIRNTGKAVNFSRLHKVLGPGQCDWFDSLSSQADERGRREANTSLPHSFFSPATPGFKHQPINATTPGLVGSLTPLSAWALLSSQDTSTPTVDRSTTSCGSMYVSPAPVESCLKTCRGISERLGLPTDDTSMSWTNSMATPCLGGELQQDQESQEPSTPAMKPKGFPRALFTPDQCRGDSEELVQELNMTQEEDVSQSGTKDPTCRQFSNMDLRKNMLLKSTGLSNQGLVVGSPDRIGSDSGSGFTSSLDADGRPFKFGLKGKESMIDLMDDSLVITGIEVVDKWPDGSVAPGLKAGDAASKMDPSLKGPGELTPGFEAGDGELKIDPTMDLNVKGPAEGPPVTPLLKSRRKMRRRRRGSTTVRSPLVSDDKKLLEVKEKNLGDIDFTDENVKFKLGILRVAAGFEDDVSALPETRTDKKQKGKNISVVSKQEGSKSDSLKENGKNDQENYKESSISIMSKGNRDKLHHQNDKHHHQNDKDSSSVMSEPEGSTSPILNRKIRKGDSHKHVKKRHSICTDTVEDNTRSIVSQVLSDFMDSPSDTSRRSCPPGKSRKRKSFEDQPYSGSEAILSTPSPLDSQTGSLQSILSSSKKRKFGSSRKRVRFAEKLCDREGETPTVAKKLDYLKDRSTCLENSELHAERNGAISLTKPSNTLCSSTTQSTTDSSTTTVSSSVLLSIEASTIVSLSTKVSTSAPSSTNMSTIFLSSNKMSAIQPPVSTMMGAQSSSVVHTDNENVIDNGGHPSETTSDSLIPDGEQILFESDLKEDVDDKTNTKENELPGKSPLVTETAQTCPEQIVNPCKSGICVEREGSQNVKSLKNDKLSDLCVKENLVSSTNFKDTFTAKATEVVERKTPGTDVSSKPVPKTVSNGQITKHASNPDEEDNFRIQTQDSMSSAAEANESNSREELVASTVSPIPKLSAVKVRQTMISSNLSKDSSHGKSKADIVESLSMREHVTSASGHLQISVEEKEKNSTNISEVDCDVPEKGASKSLNNVTERFHQTCVKDNNRSSSPSLMKEHLRNEPSLSKKSICDTSTSSSHPRTFRETDKSKLPIKVCDNKQLISHAHVEEMMSTVTSPVRPTDDLFSQVSPSSLSEMCLVATSDVKHSTVDNICMSRSETLELSSKGSEGSVTKEYGKELFKVEKQERLAQNNSSMNKDKNQNEKNSRFIQVNKCDTPNSQAKCEMLKEGDTKSCSAQVLNDESTKLSDSLSHNETKPKPVEQKANSAKGSIKDNQKPSLKTVLTKRPKKKFFYPTSSQIKAVSPKTVFNFQSTEQNTLKRGTESEDSNAKQKDTDLKEGVNTDIRSGDLKLKPEESLNGNLDSMKFVDDEVTGDKSKAQNHLQQGEDPNSISAQNKGKQTVPSAFNMDFVKFSEIFDDNMEDEKDKRASDKTEVMRSLDNQPEHQLKKEVHETTEVDVKDTSLKTSPQTVIRRQSSVMLESHRTGHKNQEDMLNAQCSTKEETTSKVKITNELQVPVSDSRENIPEDSNVPANDEVKSNQGEQSCQGEEGSNWILNTQDVNNMVEDVREELFSDIEFSQISDNPGKTIKLDQIIESDSNSTDKQSVVTVDVIKEDGKLNYDVRRVSESVCEDIHIFKKPDIPEKKTVKDSGLSDSDTDVLLSDMDMSGDGEKESRSKLSISSEPSSEFETCVSELENYDQSKAKHSKKVPASSSVSETDTDEYVTSTEEVKEPSPEPKQLPSRHKISKSRSLRKQSVLLSKSQMASDSDSDFSPAAKHAAKRGHAQLQRQNSADQRSDTVLVSESNSLIEWSDLESRKGEVNEEKGVSRRAEDQSNLKESLPRGHIASKKEPHLVLSKEGETKASASGRVSNSAWSDLEPGEADEVDEEVFFKVNSRLKLREDNMQGKTTFTLDRFEESEPMEHESLDASSGKHQISALSKSLIKCKPEDIMEPAGIRELMIDKCCEKKADIGIKESSSCPENSGSAICVGFTTAGGRKLNPNMESLHKASSFFDDMDSPKLKNMQHNLSGFAMASGKGIEMNADALEKANSLFRDVEKETTDSCQMISSKADDNAESKPLLKTALFERVDNLKLETSKEKAPALAGFSMASGKHVNLNQAALQKATAILESDTPLHSKEIKSKHIASRKKKTVINIAEVEASFNTVESGGFSTASGKNLAISDGGMMKAKSMLTDENFSACDFQSTSFNEQTELKEVNDSTSLEAMLEDLLKSKKNIQQESQKQSTTSSTALGKGKQFQSDNFEQTSNLESSLSKSKSVSARGKGFNQASKKLTKGDPMLKPKGFRPFKKPRIVPKAKVVEPELREGVEVKASSTSQVRSESEPSTSDMNDMLLLEFSKDMTELSQISRHNDLSGERMPSNRESVEVTSSTEIERSLTTESNARPTSSSNCGQGNNEQSSANDFDLSASNRSNAHLKLMDVLFDGDMSSQLDKNQYVPNHEPNPKRINTNIVYTIPAQSSKVPFKDTTSAAFQTASGKNVSVSETSLQFSRNLWNDSTEQKSNMNNEFDTNVDHVVPSIEDNTDKSKEDILKRKANDLQSSSPSPGLFQTASGKNVSISKTLLEKAKKLWTDDPQMNSVMAYNITSAVSETEATCNSGTVSQLRNTIYVETNSTSTNPFRTASGASVSVSAEALAKGRQLLSDSASVEPPPEFSSVSASSVSVSQIGNGEQLSPNKSDNEPSGFFHTASGLPVAVSATSMEFGKTLINGDVQTEIAKENMFPSAGINVSVSTNALTHGETVLIENQSTSTSSSFKTASGSSVSVSADSLVQGKKLLSDECNRQKRDTSSLFQTASGSSVTVSTKALAHGKKLLSDTEDTRSTFQKESISSVHLSARALAHGKEVLSCKEETTSTFQTGSRPSVQLSAKAHGTMSMSNEQDKMYVTSSLFQTASGSAVSVSAKALAEGKKLLNEEETDGVEPSLFQTAGGSAVSVSAKSLAHGKKLWNDEENNVPSSNLFQTASGSAVTVSAKSLAKGKKLLNEEKNEASSNLFQTASGSAVSVSAKSLAQGKKLLNDKEKNKATMSLFQTASDSALKVSSKSLAEGKKLWNKEEMNLPSANLFQTASGSAVNVSAKSLAQGKKLWNEEKDEATPSLFQTASGSTVSVSAKALTQGKKLLEEHDSETSVNHSLELEKPSDLFQTASGTSVSVSAAAIAKGKKLWTDETKFTEKTSLQTSPTDDAMSMENKSVQDKTTSQNEIQASRQLTDLPNPRDLLRSPGKKSGHEDAVAPQNRVYNLAGDRRDRRPLLCSPEAVTQDHVARDGRRFRPVRSTAFTPPQRNDEYTIEAVTSKLISNTHQPPSSSFKTPYRNTPFLAPTKQGENQSRRSAKTPVFYPKASLKIGQQEKKKDQRNPIVTSQQSDCDVMKDEASLEGQDNTERFDERQSSCLKAQLNVSKPEPMDTNVQDKELRSVNALSHSTQVKPDSSKSDYVSGSGDLEKARQNQGEIIQAKKKQKIRPCSGQLFREKTSGHHKLQLGDLHKERSYNEDELLTMGVRAETWEVNSSTAEEFQFRLSVFYPKLGCGVLLGDGATLLPDNSGFAGKDEFYRAFLTMDGVDPKLTSDLWVYNHYRLIVWKLAAYEVALPAQFGGRCLTPNNVMLQLKYRYDREVDNCQRSCIKKIVERDDTAVKRMVLCVAGVLYSTGQSGETSAETLLELTEGWYCIRARLDAGLCDLVSRKCIQVGDKICVTGAELTGSQDACTPLEIPDSLHLKICTNSCRPAPWDCRLGYQRDPRPLCVPISSLHSEGGVVGCLDVVVTRIYPLMYMEKLAEGGTVFRTEEGEEKVRREYERHKQDKMERLYSEIQSGLEVSEGKKGSRRSRKRWNQQEVENLQTGQEIYEAVEGSLAPEELHSWLSVYQRSQMEDYQRHLQEKRQQQLQDQLHQAWDKAQQGQTSRNVTPVLKIRLSGCAKKDLDAQTSTVLTVWRPSGDWLNLEEGHRYKMYTLTASPARTRLESHSVHLTASRQSRLQALSVDENYLDLLFEPREVWSVKDLRSRSPSFKEFDFVGIVVSIQSDSQRNCDTVCVSDTEGDLLNIRFWGKTQGFGVEEQMSVGKSFVGTNLILKGVYRTVLAEACHEVSRFSASSKHAIFRKSLSRFTSMSMRERSEFLERARSRQSLPNTEVMQNNQATTTPEKFFSDLPSECLQRLFSPMDEGQESKGENSGTPDALAKKRRAALRERSSKLLTYGSPKPLSTLNVQVSPATTRAFKSPFNPPKKLGESPR